MVTIISGTNRPGSNTLKVARYYRKELEKRGLKTTLIDLQELPSALLTATSYRENGGIFSDIQDTISQSDKFLFIIPEYNGSFPGALKLFIDHCRFPESFYNKKACLVGISSGRYGNIRGIDHFNGVCAYLHLNVMPLRIHISQIKSELNEEGAFYKEDTLKFVQEQIDKFLVF